MSAKTRYLGRIISVPDADGFGFIGIASVTKEDGSPHDLSTVEDIFLHKDDCATELIVGKMLVFNTIPDRKRGEGYLRAVGAVQFAEVELIPRNEPAIPGFALIVPPVRSDQEIALRERLPVHLNMKSVPEATVEQVIANAPMPRIPRVDDIPHDDRTKEHLVSWLLAMLFPHMAGFRADFRILNTSDEELNREVDETEAGYRTLGLEQEIDVLRSEVERFKGTRKAFAFMVEEDLVRRDTVIPSSYLIDLFSAVPVWYFWTDDATRRVVAEDWTSDDPRVHENVKYFCELFPTSQRWYDTFQLFNRRVRTLNQYKGEIIPPHVTRRMRKAVELFDFVVVATPYHDQAGKEWMDPKWLRAIDPYVLGFKKGIPFFFVLARFSDAGTFPLFNELVADTIEFLKANKECLLPFNTIRQPYWHQVGKNNGVGGAEFGTQLVRHVDALLAAFEAGNLFDWLRGEEAQTEK